MKNKMLEEFARDLEALSDVDFEEGVSDEENLLGSLCERYIGQLNRGEAVDKSALAAECPESLREEAGRLLDTIDLLRARDRSKAKAVHADKAPGGSVA